MTFQTPDLCDEYEGKPEFALLVVEPVFKCEFRAI